MIGSHEQDNDIIQKISKYLINKQETIAVAESVTSGLLQSALSQGEHAMQYFQGGITTYTLEQKSRHLYVNYDEAVQCNGVSPSIAKQMATGVCHLFKSDWGIGITGFATPVPESGFDLFAFFSIVHNKKELFTHKIILNNGISTKEGQFSYVSAIVNILASAYMQDE